MDYDADLHSFKVALICDTVFATIGLLGWYFGIRRTRGDHFRPYALRVHQDFENPAERLPPAAYYRDFSWVRKVWNWNIEDFRSTDTYLYLLFHKTCALLFFSISIGTVGIGFPLTFTAKSSIEINPAGIVRRRTFFERSVITNIPHSMTTRLWIIYALTWGVFVLVAYVVGIYYFEVRNGNFRHGVLTNSSGDTESRFMPNKATIMISNIDKNLAAADKIYHALMTKFSTQDIIQIHLVMDYSSVLRAYKDYERSLKKLLKLEKQILHFKKEKRAAWWAFWARPGPPTRIIPEYLDAPPSSIELPDRAQDCFNADGGDHAIDFPEVVFKMDCGTSFDSSSPSGGDADYVKLFRASLRPSKKSINGLESKLFERTLEAAPTYTESIWDTIKLQNDPPYIDSNDSLDMSIKYARSAKEKAELSSLVLAYRSQEKDCYHYYARFDKKRSQPPARNVGIAFISFSSLSAARFALSTDLSSKKNTYSTACAPVTGCAWNSKWRVREAPPPNDIVWENIHIPTYNHIIRSVISNLCVFMILLTLTSSTVIVDTLLPLAKSIENFIGRMAFLKSTITGWIIPNILYLINYILLPLLVAWAANLSKYWRRSTRDRVVLHSNVSYMVLNTVILPIIGVTSITTFILYLKSTKMDDILATIGLTAAAASSSFILRYVVNTTFLNTTFQLLQLPMFMKQSVEIKVTGKANKWDFDYGFWYAFHISVFSVCLCFSIDFPLISVIGAIFFTCKYWTDKYNMCMRVWKTTSESAGGISSTVSSSMFAFEGLMLFFMGSFFMTVAVRTEDTGGAAAANSRLFAAGALTMLAMVFFVLIGVTAEKAQRSITVKLPNVAFSFASSAINTLMCRRRIIRPPSEHEAERFSARHLEMLRYQYIHPLERMSGKYQ